MNDADRTKSQELFYDNNGRLVYAFIGVVMDKQHNDFRELTFDYLWGIYLDKIYPIWKRTYQEVILEDFVEIDTKPNNKIRCRGAICGGRKFLL